MTRPAILLLLLLFVGLAACQTDERPTPTPFPTPLPQAALPGAPQLAQGIPTTLTDLLENPDFFSGATVQVSGQFGLQPRLVCGQLTAYPSPATWTLQDGDALIQAGGFDQPLRELFPEGLTLTVVGRWQSWRGPIGCGKQATVRELYYLEVTRLLSPEQLVRVTLTPGGETAGPDAPPTAVPAPPFQETPTAVSDFPEPPEIPGETAVSTPTPTSSFPPEPGFGAATPSATPTPPDDDAGNGDDGRGDNGDGDDLTPGTTQTPGAPGTPATPSLPGDDDNATTLTPMPTSPTIVATRQATDRGTLPLYAAEFDAWGAGEAHNWRVNVQAGRSITVSLIAQPDVNVGLVLIAPDGQVRGSDSAPAGQVESLRIEADVAGVYIIQTYASDGRASRYFLSLWDETGLTRPMGNLSSGVPSPSTRPESGSLLHIWFFPAQANRTITLQVSAQPANSRFYLEVYGVDESTLANGEGEIRNLQIPLTGWYAVEVYELTLNNASYQITVTGN